MNDVMCFFLMLLCAPAIVMLTLRLSGYRIEMTFTIYQKAEETRYIYAPPSDQSSIDDMGDMYDDADWWKKGNGNNGQ